MGTTVSSALVRVSASTIGDVVNARNVVARLFANMVGNEDTASNVVAKVSASVIGHVFSGKVMIMAA